MGEQFDVAIVGARCAGASLATFLARGGAQVAIFDKDPLPSEYVLSTHTLHPPGMDVLDELGVGERIRAVTPGLRTIRFSVDEVALDLTFRDGRLEHCPRRYHLDAQLQDAAVAAGAKLFDRTRVLDVIAQRGRVAGVRVKDRAGEHDVAARLVVGADGRRSTIAARVGASEYLGYDAPRACYWAYWPVPDCWRDKQRFPFDMYLGRVGASIRFIFPTANDELLLGTSPPLESARLWKRGLMAAYRTDLSRDQAILPLIESNRPASEIRGTIREHYFFRDATGPGWALIGDAGHHKDFVIGDGISEALLQARALAAAIAQGTDDALIAWWKERDIDALPLYRFAEDQAMPTPAPKLIKHLYARLARTPGGGIRLSDVLERRASPYGTIPLSIALRAVLDGIFAGEFQTIREFMAQGRRGASVGKELSARRDRRA